MRCRFPGCPRKDREPTKVLCPGHQILFQRSAAYFHIGGVDAWIAIETASEPEVVHVNGVTNGVSE